VTQGDDDFLARAEPLAEPRGGGLIGSSGYAEGLRGTRAERGATGRDERRTALGTAFLLGAAAMGATVVAAATFTVLVFAGLFTVGSGVGEGNRPVALVQQPPATTAPQPIDAADPLSPDDTGALPPSDTTTTATFPPGTTGQSGRSPLAAANRGAVPRTTAGAQVPAQPPLNSSGLEQPSSVSPPPSSDAPSPPPSTVPAGCSKGHKQDQPANCSRD